VVTKHRLPFFAPWTAPISLPAWQELWRIFNGGTPIPIVLDLPVESGIAVSTAEREMELLDIHHKLIVGRYAEWAPGAVHLTRAARNMLNVLARPHREVDVRMEIRGEPVRVLVAAPPRGRVVRVIIRHSVVAMDVVDTVVPELAAVETLPPSPGPGRIHALAIPVADLERAIERYRSVRFTETLTGNIGRVTEQVHRLLWYDPALRAKFGIAARDRVGKRARDPFAVVVHDSPDGRHTVARRGDHITVDRAANGQLTRMLTDRLNAVGERG
jgi:hypothetical protein